jgi:ribose transport system permease protein
LSATTPRVSWRGARSRFSDEIPLVVLAGVIMVFLVMLAVESKGTFDSSTIGVLLRQSLIVGLVGIGQAVVVIGGGLDMSVGSTAKVCALVSAQMLAMGGGMADLAIPAALVTGLLIGAVNGLLITKGRGHPFIVTLGTFAILNGIALTISSGAISGLPLWFFELYAAELGPMPVAALAMVVLALVVSLVMGRTRFGRAVYAVGGDHEVARLAGIRVDAVRLATYVISGGCAALAGVLALSQAQIGTAQLGTGLEFAAITAVTLGGIDLFGGRGYIVGAVGGAFLLAVVLAYLNLLGINAFYQQFCQGVIVLLAVVFYRSTQARRR